MKKQRVVLGMSGGIDSSAAAYMLVEQGYEVIGIHNQYWVDPHQSTCNTRSSNKCCSNEGITIARKIAHDLGFPFYVFNVAEEFKAKVVDYFIREYEAGVTPNPCVMCNKHIKFGLFLDKAKALGADYIATGHYARISRHPETDALQLHTGIDSSKDQSYFLHRLDQEQLSHILFPLGEMTKVEVRAYAESVGMPFPEGKKESQGICFFPEKEQEGFLSRYVQHQSSGPIMTQDGKTVGTHKGLAYYTIGQRQGLEIGGLAEPHFVIRKDHKSNALIIGPNDALFAKEVPLQDVHFISGVAPDLNKPIEGRIRFRSQSLPMTLQETAPGEFLGTFVEPVRAITPGQSVTFHDGDVVLGGGIIRSW